MVFSKLISYYYLFRKKLFLIFEVSKAHLQISSQYLQIMDICRYDRTYICNLFLNDGLCKSLFIEQCFDKCNSHSQVSKNIKNK